MTTPADESRPCANAKCGKLMYRRDHTPKAWKNRRYCSRECSFGDSANPWRRFGKPFTIEWKARHHRSPYEEPE